MSALQNTAKILDFNAYKNKLAQQSAQPAAEYAAAPVYVWYPVWMLVPQSSIPTI